LREKCNGAHQITHWFVVDKLLSSPTSNVSQLGRMATSDCRQPFGISMSTASVDADLQRLSLIRTFSGSNEICRPTSARISSRRTPSKSGWLHSTRSCASSIFRRSRAIGAEPRRKKWNRLMLPSVQIVS
jgi:hypothetical protein